MNAYQVAFVMLCGLVGLLVLAKMAQSRRQSYMESLADVLMVTIVGQYLLYETFHYCCHVHENWFVRNVPFVNTIRRHHTAHHNQGIMMDLNMNLTFPIADWMMGTSDLDRGLLGHIFNGYDERHIKPELKPVLARHTLSGSEPAQQPA